MEDRFTFERIAYNTICGTESFDCAVQFTLFILFIVMLYYIIIVACLNGLLMKHWRAFETKIDNGAILECIFVLLIV